MQMQIGRFAIDPQKRAAFLEFAQGLVEREQGVPGCLRFELAERIDQPNHFILIEEWSSGELLEQHLESAQMQADEQTLEGFTADGASWDEFEF